MNTNQAELAIDAAQRLTRKLIEMRPHIQTRDAGDWEDRCQVQLETLCILMGRKLSMDGFEVGATAGQSEIRNAVEMAR